METYWAHIAEDGRKQSILEHLSGTAELCAAFAGKFLAQEHGCLVGMAHDIGKFSDAFQRRLSGGPIVDHATAGAIECARLGDALAASCVIGHHSGLPDFGNFKVDQPGDPTLYGRLKKGLSGGIEPYSVNWTGKLKAAPPIQNTLQDVFARSVWTRMLYSCLVDADYLDTQRFMSANSILRGCNISMPELLDRLEEYVTKWDKPANEINVRRSQILQACFSGGTQQKGLYTLTVPTGGGKTIASLAFALKHAVEHTMDRVIYIIPYTSIIEQTAGVFRKILGDENVVEHHGGVTADLSEGASVTQYTNALATENWDAPIIVTTAVQFFESFYANRSSKTRKLHNLANSILIFDEAQMIPPAHLEPCIAAISSLVAHFGATAVLCTATQPALADLFHRFAPQLKATELCPNTADLYTQFQRVSFQMVGQVQQGELADRLSKLPQVLCIVNSRKAAQALYTLLPEEGTFHLSTLMYPAHRQAALSEIRLRLYNGLPCRVVSTSLIEAGVDVDFPAVYREIAGLDSILQAAGRCNREGKRDPKSSIVTIFESEYPVPPLFEMSVGATREALAGAVDGIGTPETMQRFFAAYRSFIGQNTDQYGVVRAFAKGLAGCAMPFCTIAQRFRLIDQNTKTIYIPLQEGASIILQLQNGHRSKQLYRIAGRYAVNVYEQHFQSLLQSGDIAPLDDESAVLKNLALYQSTTGLSLEADAGKSLFI